MYNYFTTLNLTPIYNLSEAEIRKAYLAVQSKCHPDQVMNLSESERLQALQLSSSANQAYQILRSPCLRATHLWELLVPEHSLEKFPSSPTILEESLSMREKLLEAGSAEEFRQLAEEVAGLRSKIIEHLSEIFAEKEEFLQKGWELAAHNIIRLRFMDKITEEILTKRRRFETTTHI